jgi:hypothetical protein
MEPEWQDESFASRTLPQKHRDDLLEEIIKRQINIFNSQREQLFPGRIIFLQPNPPG